MSTPFTMAVERTVLAKGRGLVAVGNPVGEPVAGPVVINRADGTSTSAVVLKAEPMKAPVGAWGLLLADVTEIPVGAIIEGGR